MKSDYAYALRDTLKGSMLIFFGIFFILNSFLISAVFEEFHSEEFDSNNRTQREIVENYLIELEDLDDQTDRKLAEDLLSRKLTGVEVDLSVGRSISLIKEEGILFLVSGDGQKHDVLSYKKEYPDLLKIVSFEDGSIKLIRETNTVHLKDTTLDQWSNFDFELGNIILDGGRGRIICEEISCKFSLSGININLNQEGFFENLGGDRFSVVDGTTITKEAVLTGSYEFSTNKIGDRINFNKKINLRTFSREGELKLADSTIETKTDKYGKVVISTASAFNEKTLSRVIVCFDCNNFVKHVEQYSGYVDLDALGEGKFIAEIKGKSFVSFEDDVSHNGFSENLLLTYENSALTEAIFRLKSCEGCGDDESVGLQLINGHPFRIINEFDEKGKQGFGIKKFNPAFPINKDFSRNIYIIDETAESAELYLINPGISKPVIIEVIDQELLDEYLSYGRISNEREIKINGICNKLSSSECSKFSSFANNLRIGNDGNFNYPTLGEDSCEEVGTISLKQGGCMVVQDPEIIKLINEGKISNEDLISLGEINNEVRRYENIEKFKTLITAFLPNSEGELLFNIATGGSTKFAMAGMALTRARNVVSVAKAVSSLGVRGTGAALVGYSGANLGAVSKLDDVITTTFKPQNFDDITDIGKVPYNPNTQAKLYLNNLASKVSGATGIPPNELHIVTLDNKPLNLGLKNEKTRVLAFFRVDPETGIKTSLGTGFLHTGRKGAIEHMKSLTELETRLGESGFSQRFKGAFSHEIGFKDGSTGEAVIVFRETSSIKFAREVENLPNKNELIRLYEECCAANIISRNTPPKIITGQGSFIGILPENLNLIDEGLKRISIQDTSTGKRVGTLSYGIRSDDPRHLISITTDVNFRFRGQGLQNAMFERLLSEGDFNKISTVLLETNEEAFATALINNLRSKYKISDFSPEGLSGKQLSQCCRDILNQLKESSKEELDEIIRESLKNTPAYKSRKRFGFETCDHSFTFRKDNPSDFVISFTACK